MRHNYCPSTFQCKIESAAELVRPTCPVSFCVLPLLLCFQLYLCSSPFWVRVLHMWPFFNPTTEVVTFRLRGWLCAIPGSLLINCSPLFALSAVVVLAGWQEGPELVASFNHPGFGVQCVPPGLSQTCPLTTCCRFLLLLLQSQLYLWGSPLSWVRFLCMWPFFGCFLFNPAIEVDSFPLRGWCVLRVILLSAFTHQGHECQDLLSPCHGMNVCTD